MLAALDVHYGNDSRANAAAVVFADWSSDAVVAQDVATIENVAAYEPGQFYKREMPCLLAVIAKIKEPIDTYFIDGYVQFNDNKPGLGAHLYDHFIQNIPIIGIAKTHFQDAKAEEVHRGQSQNPLYVTSKGIDPAIAAQKVKSMVGEHRLPKMIKLVDRLSRS